MVEAVRKDQEGDANAALSLYCKALEYFVPALHCESPQGLCGAWVCFWGCSTLGEASFQPTHPSVWSFSPSDESDARRKEAIRAKVSQNPWGGWGQHPRPLHPISGVSSPPKCAQVGQYISRAEELKVLVTSSNKNLLEKGNPARELLKGGDF